jgi:hypothetical protein
MKRTKGKVKHENPIEKFFESLSGTNPQASETVSNSEKKHVLRSGELMPNEELILTKAREEKAEKQEKMAKIDPGIDYAREIVQTGERASNHENKELEAQLKEIMVEIKKLADSSKELQVQFKTVAVEQYVTKPGKYHKSFFTWLLSIIKAARAKVEDSSSWLAAMHSKKKSRGYSARAEEEGTSFTQNGDRTPATQTG